MTRRYAITALKPRHFDVLRGLIEGKSNKEIGRDLNINHFVVADYIGEMIRFAKLEIKGNNRTSLVIWAIRQGHVTI